MPKPKITPTDPQFTEVVAGLLHEVLKVSGVSMVPVKSHERIRTIAQKLAEAIEYHAERKAIEVAKILQGAVKEGFNGLEQDLLSHEKKLKEFETELHRLEQEAVDTMRSLSMASPNKS